VIEDLKKNRRTFTQNLLKLDIPGPFIQYTLARLIQGMIRHFDSGAFWFRVVAC
jgi:hypothetical protein